MFYVKWKENKFQDKTFPRTKKEFVHGWGQVYQVVITFQIPSKTFKETG